MLNALKKKVNRSHALIVLGRLVVEPEIFDAAGCIYPGDGLAGRRVTIVPGMVFGRIEIGEFTPLAHAQN